MCVYVCVCVFEVCVRELSICACVGCVCVKAMWRQLCRPQIERVCVMCVCVKCVFSVCVVCDNVCTQVYPRARVCVASTHDVRMLRVPLGAERGRNRHQQPIAAERCAVSGGGGVCVCVCGAVCAVVVVVGGGVCAGGGLCVCVCVCVWWGTRVCGVLCWFAGAVSVSVGCGVSVYVLSPLKLLPDSNPHQCV